MFNQRGCTECVDGHKELERIRTINRDLIDACKSALRIAEMQEPIPIAEAIKERALLITELIAAMKAAGCRYQEMSK